MRDSARIIIFAAALGLVCSLMLTGATLLTAPFRQANEQAEEVRNFLSALEVDVDAEAEASELIEVFERTVKVKELGELTVYEYIPEGSTRAASVAAPFSGMGLWGPVKGVLALEPDLTSIRGIRFYQQEETPGLGGEIGAVWFQDQFVKKKIVAEDGTPGFRIQKPGGSTTNINSVDGISGATMTSDRVAEMIDKLAHQLFKERDNYQKEQK